LKNMVSLNPSKIKAFQRVLVANRGEISCRIQETCHRLGIETIAVGSTFDREAKHMQMANMAIVLPGEEAQETYLNGEAIILAAHENGAQAIHPGYGFLSENSDFAQNVNAARLTFIGPTPDAIRIMGSKSEAKAIATSVNVPVISGYDGQGDLKGEARRLGFPLLIKATFGGGGKGMRLVHSIRNFEEALKACQREAMAAFGNDQVMLEKYLEAPRHIEVQILCDQHRKCVVLSERDCSLQRRHQKVIEEAPSTSLSTALRGRLHNSAIAIARAVSYEGVGTVEFLVTQNGEFFFLEMNTRLQVEHPVTEMVLGLDLVEWQLRVAAGETLYFEQNETQPKGHAIEARLYAEDGDNNFLPSTGTITQLEFPIVKNVRIDTGIREGDDVSIYYDPMIAKISAWGENRERAIVNLKDALANTHVKGLKTNLKFLQRLMAHPFFIRDEIDIGFVDRYVDEWAKERDAPEEAYILAALWHYQRLPLEVQSSAWIQQDGWRLNSPPVHTNRFDRGGEVTLCFAPDHIGIRYAGKVHKAQDIYMPDKNKLLVTIDREKIEAQIFEEDEEIRIIMNDRTYRVRPLAPNANDDRKTGPSHLMAPMPGRVVSVLVKKNEAVEAGQPLLILEAMKMEHTICAPYAGLVEALPFARGDFCDEGVELVCLSPTK
jgi:3-methylcrotonyl-CoA carboxylase alpha subunit